MDATARGGWERLYALAARQSGLFTVAQAATVGFSWALLHHHVRAMRVRRVQRGIYRLVHFPTGPQEALVALWLWSGCEATVSHASALALYGLGGDQGGVVHLIVPTTWRAKRFRKARALVLFAADLGDGERGLVDGVPVTTVKRTLEDLAFGGMEATELRRVTHEALRRGLVARADLALVRRVLRADGGLRRREAGRVAGLGDLASGHAREEHEAAAVPVPAEGERSLDWDRLYEIAAAQSGVFSSEQAAEVGYTRDRLGRLVRAGRLARMMRGVYRLLQFPERPWVELVALWLWATREATFSHETALAVHGLSVQRGQVHMTVSSGWERRRLRVPVGVTLHYVDVGDGDRMVVGSVPVTTPRRALEEVARAGMEANALRDVTNEASRRGLVGRGELDVVRRVLKPVGGLGRA